MNSEITDLASSASFVETPTDVFRRRLTVGILIGAGAIFLILVCGGMYVLIRGEGESLNAAQTILTTSIGVVAGVVGTIVGFFFQSREN
ncbi:MAG: hypothetical protein KAV82_00375 [Phycisphaerae bacterium]|nr:hypothetical protein [Phycisphaerae bacterium]